MEEETFDFAIAHRYESIEGELQLECSIKKESVEEKEIQNEKLKDLSIDSLNQFSLQNSVLSNEHFASNLEQNYSHNKTLSSFLAAPHYQVESV